MEQIILNNEGSIIITKNVTAGTAIHKKMLGIDFSTESGISPKLLNEIIGKKIAYDLKKGSILTFGFIRQ